MSAAQRFESFESDPARLRLAVAPARDRAAVATEGRRSLRHYRDLVTLTDGAIVLASVAAAVLWRFGTGEARLDVLGFPIDYWVITGLILVSWMVALSVYRTRDLRTLGAGSQEYRKVVAATATVFGLSAILMVILKVDIARGFYLVAFPLGLVLLLCGRRVWRGWLASQRRVGRYTSAAVVVGPLLDVRRVLASLAQSHSAYRVIGVVLDDDRIETTVTTGSGTIPVVGSIDDVAHAARVHQADSIIVAGQPRGGSDFIRNLSWSLERTNAELMIASRLANVAGPRIQFRPADGLPLMHVELPSYEGGKHVAKRALDMAVAGGALLFLSPLFLVIAALIKRDSAGPVIFSQDRVGRNGQLFRMYKFRSMVTTAESDLTALMAQNEGAGVLFKMREDPRITKIGKVLRKYSLDELPQLWNVLLGDMSLVGPRPPLGREVQEYENHVLRRLYIKPGLTGMWQISGRSNLSWEDSVRLDLYYVENWSLAGDLMILWRTAKVVIKPDGAY